MKMEKQETAKTIAGHDVKRVHEKISDYLVRSEYDYICVINTQTGMLYVDTDELHADWDWNIWQRRITAMRRQTLIQKSGLYYC